MAKNAPGQSHRKGLSFFQVAEKFSDENKARKWISDHRWPDGPCCPRCGSVNVQCGIKHKTMSHRCRDCPGTKMFSVKMGTVMEGSKLPYRAWAVGIYLFTTNIKGISSMKLHRELGIGQKAAWFMLARLRKAYEIEVGPFAGPVEVDETFVGGKERNKHASKKLRSGRGAVGKTAVVGARDRETNRVKAKVVQRTDKQNLQGFVRDQVKTGATVYTDEHRAYFGLHGDYRHAAVQHKIKQFVDGQAHTNGIESFWAMLKRAYTGTYHRISPKHLQRYIDEFAGRHNVRDQDTVRQMSSVVRGMEAKRLRYNDLIADNGLSSTADE